MTNAPWKDKQDEIAAMLGGKRSGLRDRGKADVEAEDFAVELRQRDELPLWITSAVERARKLAGDGRLGVLVLSETGIPGGLVVLDLRDFRDWYV